MTAHLIQTTLLAGLIWLVTLLLRGNAAKHRHTLWMIASLKFFVPFSILVVLGNRIDWHPVSMQPTHPLPRIVFALGAAASPVIRNPHPASPAPKVPVFGFPEAIWILGVLAVAGARLLALRRAASTESLEPGVFGIIRPTLRIPQRVADALPRDQLEAVIAHERCHIDRRDNLVGAIHMVVEALFWFHPLVWWIGARLIEERELACDEAVISRISNPETYARAILSVARICLRSPVACISGVTGSNLTRRIERIMSSRTIRPVSVFQRTALAVFGVSILAGPLFVGISGTAHAQPQEKHLTFEVASIRVAKDNNPRNFGDVRFMPGGKLVANQVPLVLLIAAAYDLPFQSARISLAPGVKPPQQNYDIEAVGPASAFPPGITVQARNARIRLMLQSLLSERFHMKIRVDPKEQPVYALVVGNAGPRLEKSKMTDQDCDKSEEQFANTESCHGVGGGQGRGIHGSAISIADVALFVQNWTDKPVVDETGLKDLYNIQTEGWTPMRIRPPNPDGSAPGGGDAGLNDPDRQTLFKVFEGLGLRMESKRAMIDMYVVEAVEKPTEN